jgi:hypothetical protein
VICAAASQASSASTGLRRRPRGIGICAPAPAALVDLGRHHKLFTDKFEHE